MARTDKETVDGAFGVLNPPDEPKTSATPVVENTPAPAAVQTETEAPEGVEDPDVELSLHEDYSHLEGPITLSVAGEEPIVLKDASDSVVVPLSVARDFDPVPSVVYSEVRN